MNDQAENLRRAIKRISAARVRRVSAIDIDTPARVDGNQARVITVTSGKGGVGKTSVSVNLALALAGMNKKPLIIDADAGLSNVEVLFGIIPKYSFLDVLNNEKTVREIICDGPNGVKLISGGSGADVFARIADTHMTPFISELAVIDGEFDVIIIDTGAGISETVLNMAVAADDAVVITTPEPTSVTDAYTLIKAIVLRERGKSVRLIVNKADNEAEAADIMSRLEQVTGKFLDLKLQKLGYILNDPLVVKSVKQQLPFMLSAPQSPTSRRVAEIAGRLMDGVSYSPFPQGRGLSGFLNGIAKFVNIQVK